LGWRNRTAQPRAMHIYSARSNHQEESLIASPPPALILLRFSPWAAVMSGHRQDVVEFRTVGERPRRQHTPRDAQLRGHARGRDGGRSLRAGGVRATAGVGSREAMAARADPAAFCGQMPAILRRPAPCLRPAWTGATGPAESRIRPEPRRAASERAKRRLARSGAAHVGSSASAQMPPPLRTHRGVWRGNSGGSKDRHSNSRSDRTRHRRARLITVSRARLTAMAAAVPPRAWPRPGR
jgi:hypothetical protein